MRTFLIVLVALAGCSRPARDRADRAPEVGPRYVSLDRDALVTARDVAFRHGTRIAFLEADAEVAVVALDAGILEALAEQMHAQHQRCGGFLVHDSLEDAHASLHVPQAAALDYTLDRPAAVAAVLPAIEAPRIAATIRELSAMPNRYYRSPSGEAASIWLRDRWRSLTTRSDVTVELFDQGYPQKSVILTIPGSTRADEVVVLGGHLDSIALGGAGSTAPGADDDASGIATLTEVARALLAADFRPERTVQLIAYAAEEVGLRGSQAIVRDYRARGVHVVGALQLDMTNYQGSDKDIWLMKDFTSAAQNTFLTQLIDRYVGATWGLDACGYACSDHASWYRAGVPASMPFESRMSQRNRSIHTRNDTLETSGNNAAHAVKFARLGAAYAIELGKGGLGPAAVLAGAPSSRAPARPAWGGEVLLGLALVGLLAIARRWTTAPLR